MIRALIIYDTMHDNTKIVAKNIAKAIRTGGKIETSLIFVEDVDIGKITEYDIIVIGSPNHYSKPTKKMSEFIKKLEGLDLEGKRIAAFDTCLRRQEGRTFGRIERAIREVVPGAQLISPGLSILVAGVKGPILDGEHRKCKDFVKRIVKG